MRLTLDNLVDNRHLPDKIHEKLVADLLALVYLVIGLERPHNYQRYLDVMVGCSRMEEGLSDRGARFLRTAAYSSLILREQHSPPIVAFVPLEILVRIDHYESYPRVSIVRDWYLIDHNLERECRRLNPSTLLGGTEVVAPQPRNEHFHRPGTDYILDLVPHTSHWDLTGVGVVCRIDMGSYRPLDE